jgi:23S rRNA (cytidine1920-2'-O)/16S rRNA (cytidine1409-2'-O)-methyltransferase
VRLIALGIEARRQCAGLCHGLLGDLGREGGCPLSHVFFQLPYAVIGNWRICWLRSATQITNDCTIERFCNIHIEHESEARKLTVKMRLDRLLVERGFAATRSKAQDLIRRGAVKLEGELALKTGLEARPDADLQILETAHYVSRGALKLKAALAGFSFSPEGLVCLDAGSSTGGFTQVLLEQGAACIFAVDTGTRQLDPSITANPKVISMEKTDVRHLSKAMFPKPPGALTLDLSFISLLKILPAVLPLADEGAWLVALIKPQFEVGRALVGKKGIVKDETAKQEAIDRVAKAIEASGWTLRGLLRSPVLGQDGNEETLAGAIRAR